MQPFFSTSLSWFSHFHWLWVTNPSVIPQWPALSPWKLCLILNYILSRLLVLIYHSSGTAMILHFIYRKFLLACNRKKTHSLSIIRNNHCVFWFLNSLLNLAANYSFKGNIWKYIIYLHTFAHKTRTYLVLWKNLFLWLFCFYNSSDAVSKTSQWPLEEEKLLG